MTRIPIAEANMREWVMRRYRLLFSACLYDGLPLIYSGQELPNKKRLMFFDKDEIDWSEPCYVGSIL